jgi:hypothetical protein
VDSASMQQGTAKPPAMSASQVIEMPAASAPAAPAAPASPASQ